MNHLYLRNRAKKGELQIWSLQISSFPRNFNSQLQLPYLRNMQIKTFNHAESTGDTQEKQARSYEIAFAENKKCVNSKFGAHFF
jgi:hypothetical protein